MAVDDAYVFPGFLSPVLTQLFFPKPPTTFPTCSCRGERRKYAGAHCFQNSFSRSNVKSQDCVVKGFQNSFSKLNVKSQDYVVKG